MVTVWVKYAMVAWLKKLHNGTYVILLKAYPYKSCGWYGSSNIRQAVMNASS